MNNVISLQFNLVLTRREINDYYYYTKNIYDPRSSPCIFLATYAFTHAFTHPYYFTSRPPYPTLLMNDPFLPSCYAYFVGSNVYMHGIKLGQDVHCKEDNSNHQPRIGIVDEMSARS